MNARKLLTLAFATLALLATGLARAQAPTPYGLPITLDQAKKAMAAAEAEAKKNNWNMVIAIVDAGGNLMLLQRLGQHPIRLDQRGPRKKPSRQWPSGARPRPGRT
jgi:hypothetical protein